MNEQLLVKNTMADMKSLLPAEILDLQNNIYIGILLLGYYEKGDTPNPIVYYKSNTNEIDDGGSVVDIGSLKLKHEFITEINVLYYGIKGDGVTNDLVTFNRALNKAVLLKIPLQIKGNNNILINISEGSLVINGSIDVIMDKTSFFTIVGNNSGNTLFSLSNTISSAAKIVLTGINTKGNIRRYFLRSQPNETPSTKIDIHTLIIENCNLGSHPIFVDFFVTEFLKLDNIIGGNELTANMNSSFRIIINEDINRLGQFGSVIMNNIWATAGGEDVDILAIKLANYKSSIITGVTTESKAFIALRTGDGIDADGLGVNVLMSNIRCIRCGFEIKSGNTLNRTYNLNISEGGLALRADGNYSNIIITSPQVTALTIANIQPTDGSLKEDCYINIDNLKILYSDTINNTSSPITIGCSNVKLTNVSISTSPKSQNLIVSPLFRVTGDIRNLIINNVLCKNGAVPFFMVANSILKSCVFANIQCENITNAIYSISDNVELSDVMFDTINLINYSGSLNNVVLFRASQIIKQLRINNFGKDYISVIYNNVGSHCGNVIFDGTNGVDTISAANAVPIDSNVWKIGTLILNIAGNKLITKLKMVMFL